MSLWMPWWNAIWRLRPAFSRLRTFLWFATAVAGFTVRTELLGVTSLVRALKLEARFYNKLVDHKPSHKSTVAAVDRGAGVAAVERGVGRRHQGAEARPQDAGCQTPASAVRSQTPNPNTSWDTPSRP